MRETPTVSDLAPLHIDRRQVLRNLGYPRSREPSAQVAAALSRLWEPALALLVPRGVHRMVRDAVARTTGMPRPTEWVGLGACTAGPELERREQQLVQQGQMLDALILDAIGSTAAEAAADAVNVMLCTEARREGYHLPPRISPGYGRWPVERQPDLLRLLAADTIGIHLTPGLMMVPRKSVSFGVRLTRQPQPRAGAGAGSHSEARSGAHPWARAGAGSHSEARSGAHPWARARGRCAGCALEGCTFRDQPPEGHEEP